jgi:hypothetical protein
LRKEGEMQVGDKITFPFGKDEKEGTVFKVFPKTVYIKVDFAKHKGKIIKRSIIDVQSDREAKKKDEKKRSEEKKRGVTKKEDKAKEKEKKKIKAAKEDRKKEKAA